MISNVKIEVLDLFSHIESRVAVIVVDGEVGYEGALHAFLTNDALADFMNRKRAEEPERKFMYVEDSLGAAINYTIWNDVEGMSLHSSVETQFDIVKADLESMTDIVDSFSVMTSVNKGRMSMAEAIDRLRNKEVYFMGEMPKQSVLLERRDMVLGASLLKRVSGDDHYESIAAFLTPKSAMQNAGPQHANMPVSKCKLKDLAAMWNYLYPITLEPQKSFCIELAPATLASL